MSVFLLWLALQVPCGFDASGAPWYVIRFGSDPPVYAPCPSDVTPTPAPLPPPPWPERAWLPVVSR